MNASSIVMHVLYTYNSILAGPNENEINQITLD